VPRTKVAALVVVLLALPVSLAPKGRASGPEAVSGSMVFDPITDDLLRYHEETGQRERLACLRRLARTRDPRVAILLGEQLHWSSGLRVPAAELLLQHYARIPTEEGFHVANHMNVVESWWAEHEADFRRRARQLP
jgi:hypothetical protein